jgi:hypothetical protein
MHRIGAGTGSGGRCHPVLHTVLFRPQVRHASRPIFSEPEIVRRLLIEVHRARTHIAHNASGLSQSGKSGVPSQDPKAVRARNVSCDI